MRRYWEDPPMDLMEKLASLAKRYEELNTLMAQPELFGMYSRYAYNRRWKIEIMDINETGQVCIKVITVVVKGKVAYSRLKYEGGTYLVQRVPVTEANGSIHTSTAKVILLPEADED